MGGRLAHLAEVVQRRYDARSKMMAPDTVDNHTGRERVFGRTKPFGKSSSSARSAAARRGIFNRRCPGRYHADESRLHERPAAFRIATNQEIGWRRLIVAGPREKEAAFDGLALYAFARCRFIARTVRREAIIAVRDDRCRGQRLGAL